MDALDLARLLVTGQSVVASRTLRAAGMSRSAWGRLVQRDGVDRPFRGVAVLDASRRGTLVRMEAALAAVACPAMLTGWSAAYMYGWRDTAPSRVHLLLPHGSSVTRRDGLEITESSVLPVARTEAGLPVAPAARVLADLAPRTTADAVLNLAIDARFHGHLAAGALDATLVERRRFPGRPRLRAVADELRDDASDSGFEHTARARLTDLGLPPDRGQHKLVVAGRTRRIDLPYARQQVGIECLGLAAHSGRAAFDADAERRNDFAEEGEWTLLELTWTTFHQRWDEFVGRLARVLTRRSP